MVPFIRTLLPYTRQKSSFQAGNNWGSCFFVNADGTDVQSVSFGRVQFDAPTAIEDELAVWEWPFILGDVLCEGSSINPLRASNMLGEENFTDFLAFDLRRFLDFPAPKSKSA